MKSAVFLGLWAVGYVLLICWIISKLRDISTNPKKYDVIPGWETYRTSSWYECKYQRYGRHYYASLCLTVPLLFFLVVLYLLFSLALQKLLFLPDGAQSLSSPGLTIGSIACIFFSIGFTQFLLFYGKKPIMIAARLYYSGHNQHKPTAWKNMFVWLLVLSIICLPVMAIGIHSYSFADTERIVIHSAFSVVPQEIPYTAVESGTTYYTCNNAYTEFSLRYSIRLYDGTVIQVDQFGPKGMDYIDTMLQMNNVPISRGEIDAFMYDALLEKCNDKDIARIEQYLTIIE